MQLSRRKFLSELSAISMLSMLSLPEAIARWHSPHPIPEGYRRVGREAGVPAAILFAVALQESQQRYGSHGEKRSLPWPWTLNMEGTPFRFATREAATRALAHSLANRKRLIDVGLMQVCWHYFQDRLYSAARALDPYWNLHVGAAILREHFDASQSWIEAIGRYHAPADPARAARYASRVVRHMENLLHA